MNYPAVVITAQILLPILVLILICVLTVKLYRAVKKWQQSPTTFQFNSKWALVVCVGMVCATAWGIYSDYQTREDERIKQQAIDEAQQQSDKREADIKAEAFVASMQPKFVPPPPSSIVPEAQPAQNDAMLQEMHRANELAEQANDIARQAALQRQLDADSPPPAFPQTITVEPDFQTRMQNQEAVDEMRRMREVQEQEQQQQQMQYWLNR